MVEHIEYVEGHNDGVRRRVYRAPWGTRECTAGYEPMMLEVEPGRWVLQIVDSRRVKREQSK